MITPQLRFSDRGTIEGQCLTIRGYLAYALCFVEAACLATGVKSREAWSVMELLWFLLSCDSVGEWDWRRREGKPGEAFCAILDHLDSSHPLSRASRLPASSPLLEFDDRIMRMIAAADEIAMRYMYGAVAPGAPDCAEGAMRVAALGEEFDLGYPPADLFRPCSVPVDPDQNAIWGAALDTRPFRQWAAKAGARHPGRR